MDVRAGLGRRLSTKELMFELWCWRRLLRVPWAARRGNYKTRRILNSNCDKIDTQSDFVSIRIFTEVSCITLKKLIQKRVSSRLEIVVYASWIWFIEERAAIPITNSILKGKTMTLYQMVANEYTFIYFKFKVRSL